MSTLPTADAALLVSLLGRRKPIVIVHIDDPAEESGDPAMAANPELVTGLRRLGTRCGVVILGDYDAAALRDHYDVPAAWIAGYGGLELVAPDGTLRDQISTATDSSIRGAAEQLGSQPHPGWDRSNAMRCIAEHADRDGRPLLFVGFDEEQSVHSTRSAKRGSAWCSAALPRRTV